MATPDPPQDQSPGHGDDGDTSNPRIAQRSRLEQALVKNSDWKKQTLRDIEHTRTVATTDSSDRDSQVARLIARLTAQLDERNDEIERLRRAVSDLEDEMSRLGRAHQRELEERRAELEHLQDAYDQFEKESDSLLSELSRQNERLRKECH